MQLKRADLLTLLLLLVSLGQFASTPQFVNYLQSIATGPWPDKVSATLAIIGYVAAIAVARVTGDASGSPGMIVAQTNVTAAPPPDEHPPTKGTP